MGHRPRYRKLDAWKAYLDRDLEYGINLLHSGEWTVNGVVKDGFSFLDARVGSERCQETALLVLILRQKVIDFLEEEGLDEEFDELITQYRVKHASDKDWTAIFVTEDVRVENAVEYEAIKQAIIDRIGSKWAMFLGLARTLTSFSVLTDMEAGMPVRYRRKNDVFVETSKEHRTANMDEYHDIEFAMRKEFTAVSFDLIEEVADTVLGEKALPFGDKPRRCSTIIEQAREIFHFSMANKINPGHKEYPIKIGSFSASTIILLFACYHFNIPIVECMPRLKYEASSRAACDEPTSASIKYEVTAAPVLTFVRNEAKRGYKAVSATDEDSKKKPAWKLGGFSMYNMKQAGDLLSSPYDREFIAALMKYDVSHRLAIFGFCHNEYPAATEDGGVNLVSLMKEVCGGSRSVENVTLESLGSCLSLDVNDQAGTASFMSLATAITSLARKHNLHDTFLAHQRDPATRSAYLMQHKSIPYTYNHIEVSTAAREEAKWAKLVKKFQSTAEPIYANLFTIGNVAYSIADQKEADRLMQLNNDTQKASSGCGQKGDKKGGKKDQKDQKG
ncbi:uncharacterized protein K489DRAFT_354335, partial [Dissoconium aciculare CBS 342.82]|uniref:Uncharacterized protein n=1 Tax=Dissoconium aciculare CBS 342.82 TaxID=1314786 RepID=A0A6J3M8S5_9PEZI